MKIASHAFSLREEGCVLPCALQGDGLSITASYLSTFILIIQLNVLIVEIKIPSVPIFISYSTQQ